MLAGVLSNAAQGVNSFLKGYSAMKFSIRRQKKIDENWQKSYESSKINADRNYDLQVLRMDQAQDRWIESQSRSQANADRAHEDAVEGRYWEWYKWTMGENLRHTNQSIKDLTLDTMQDKIERGKLVRQHNKAIRGIIDTTVLSLPREDYTADMLTLQNAISKARIEFPSYDPKVIDAFVQNTYNNPLMGGFAQLGSAKKGEIETAIAPDGTSVTSVRDPYGKLVSSVTPGLHPDVLSMIDKYKENVDKALKSLLAKYKTVTAEERAAEFRIGAPTDQDEEASYEESLKKTDRMTMDFERTIYPIITRAEMELRNRNVTDTGAVRDILRSAFGPQVVANAQAWENAKNEKTDMSVSGIHTTLVSNLDRMMLDPENNIPELIKTMRFHAVNFTYGLERLNYLDALDMIRKKYIGMDFQATREARIEEARESLKVTEEEKKIMYPWARYEEKWLSKEDRKIMYPWAYKEK